MSGEFAWMTACLESLREWNRYPDKMARRRRWAPYRIATDPSFDISFQPVSSHTYCPPDATHASETHIRRPDSRHPAVIDCAGPGQAKGRGPEEGNDGRPHDGTVEGNERVPPGHGRNLAPGLPEKRPGAAQGKGEGAVERRRRLGSVPSTGHAGVVW